MFVMFRWQVSGFRWARPKGTNNLPLHQPVPRSFSALRSGSSGRKQRLIGSIVLGHLRDNPEWRSQSHSSVGRRRRGIPANKALSNTPPSWRVKTQAERGGQLDPQSLVAQSVGVLIGSPSLIAGKLP